MPRHMKRHVKANRVTLAFLMKGCAYPKSTDGVAPGLSIGHSFAATGEAVPAGTEQPLSNVHQV